MKTKIKTIREWLEELPEPFKSKAIANTSKEKLKETQNSLLFALACAFNWSKSPEGKYFWENYYNQIELKLVNPTKYKNIVMAEKVINFSNVANDYLSGKIKDKKFTKLIKEFKNELK